MYKCMVENTEKNMDPKEAHFFTILKLLNQVHSCKTCDNNLRKKKLQKQI